MVLQLAVYEAEQQKSETLSGFQISTQFKGCHPSKKGWLVENKPQFNQRNLETNLKKQIKMSMNENEVRNHYQTGFCKYQQQCTKEHVNYICNDKYECKDITCKMRHPKICKIFKVFGKCMFDDCAYHHVNNTDNNKVKVLENEV